MNYQIVLESSNSKVGAIPITNSHRGSCPDACPLKYGKGCYAEHGYYTKLNWNKIDSGERGTDWCTFVSDISKLKPLQLWRHNVSGDLPKDNKNKDNIDAEKLKQLVEANEGKRGFTYTHYALNRHNLDAIKSANNSGFTINVSANNLKQAQEYFSKELPTVTIVSESKHGTEWRKLDNVVQCPAEYLDTNCKECGLCQKKDRKVIVGFTVHGKGIKHADLIASVN